MQPILFSVRLKLSASLPCGPNLLFLCKVYGFSCIILKFPFKGHQATFRRGLGKISSHLIDVQAEPQKSRLLVHYSAGGWHSQDCNPGIP